MTTAARPTFEPARGGTGRGENDLSALSVQYSSRDLPSHTKLKYREPGQGTTDELHKQDFAKLLDEREKGVAPKSIGSEPPTKKIRPEHVPIATLDVDDPLDLDASDDEDSEDDAEELMLELQKIKKERMAEDSRMEAEKREAEEQIRIQNILQGNPLLTYGGGGSVAPKANQKVKRRWNDDVVFKNCARSEPEKSTTFINDCIRSDFHRKFMDKYIK
ncbi:protein CWC15 homolog [Adelges cooleyi]|uniref:protein CWC15 homolog n=1 Tax=Adelges cooleyi TaxID=133065 RepID=UPI00218064C7|nr:protein CWC15 homolog [Adelges cooleyi]